MGNSCLKHATAAPDTGSLASSNGIAREFLEGIGLGIYVVAFEVSGFDSPAALQCLTEWDLDSIANQSHIPILPAHRDKILAASKNYVAQVTNHTQSELGEQDLQPTEQPAEQADSTEPAGHAQQQQQQEMDDTVGELDASSAASTEPLFKRWFSRSKQQQEPSQPPQQLAELESTEQLQQPPGALAGAAGAGVGHVAACSLAAESAAAQSTPDSTTADTPLTQQEEPVPSPAAPAAAAVASVGDSTSALLEAKATVAAADAAVSRLIRKLQQVCPKAWRTPDTSEIEPIYEQLQTVQEQQEEEEGEQQQQQQQRPKDSSVMVVSTVATTAAADVQAKKEQLASEFGNNSAEAAEPAPAAAAASDDTVLAAKPAAVPPAGPLIANKSAILNKSLSNGSRLPPIMPRKAPSAWQELPGEMTKLSYAVSAPLSAHPLPQPSSTTAAKLAADLHSRHREAPAAAGAWAGLPNEVTNLSYAATAPISGNTMHVPSSASAAAAGAAAGVSGKQQQQQQDGPLVTDLVHLSTRHCSDPGYQREQQRRQQQQQRQSQHQQSSAPNSARTISAAAPAAAGQAAAASLGGSSNAAVPDLPPSVQQLHQQVMARLRAQGSSSTGTGTAAAADVAASISDIYKGSAWAAGQQVPPVLVGPALSQEESQQVICRLVKEVANSPVGGTSSSRTGAGASGHNSETQMNDAAAAAAAAAAGARASSARLLHAVPAVSQHSAMASHGEQLSAQRSGAAAGGGFADLVAAGSAIVQQEGSVGPGRSYMQLDLSRCSLNSNSNLFVGSIAGSMAGERPLSSRAGSRAADVSMIVHRAKERAAARHWPGPWTPRSNRDSCGSLMLSPRAPQQSQLQQQQQQQVCLSGMVGDGSQTLLPLPGQSSSGPGSSRCISEENSTTSLAAVGMQDGERTMRMLQDYRTISELDTAIRARMSHIAHQPDVPLPGRTAAAAAGGAGSLPARSGSSAAVAGAAGVKDVAAKRQAAGGGAAWRSAASGSPEADTAVRLDSGPQHHQQQLVSGGAYAAADVLAVGLLGIQEALDNSYDAGKPAGRCQGSSNTNVGASSRGAAAAAAAAAAAPDGYHNPFISPTTSPTPPAAAVQLPGAVTESGYEKQQQQQWGQASQKLSWAAEQNVPAMGLMHMVPPGAAGVSGCAKLGMLASPAGPAACGSSGAAVAGGGGGVASSWHPYAAAVPAVALASKGAASAAAAARSVDERIKRIVLASRARAAAAGAGAGAAGGDGGPAGPVAHSVVL